MARRFGLHLHYSTKAGTYQISQDWNVVRIQSEVSVGLVDGEAV